MGKKILGGEINRTNLVKISMLKLQKKKIVSYLNSFSKQIFLINNN